MEKYMEKKNKYDNIFTLNDIETIRCDYLSGLSIRDIATKYNIKSSEWIRKKLKDIIRDTSTANKIAHERSPWRFKLSDEAKDKIRKARLKFMKEHPEETAWRKRNEPSYPEKCFIKYLEDRGIDKKYNIEREKSFFPYFADFAFNDIKLVVEIDGSQHIYDKKRRESDIKKDALIEGLGWKIIHYSENTVKTDWDLIDKTLLLDNYEKIESGLIHGVFKHQTGIYKTPKRTITIYKKSADGKLIKKKKNIYIKKEREENGYTKEQNEHFLKIRRCTWPTKEELEEMIKTSSYAGIARKYGISDKAVAKWFKKYGIYEHRRLDHMPIKICPVCGKEFIPQKDSRQRFCSTKCVWEFNRKCLITYENMIKLLKEYKSTFKIAEVTGFSEKTIRNRCETLNINIGQIKSME